MVNPLTPPQSRQRFESEITRRTQSIVAIGPYDQVIGTSATTIYTVPAGRFFLIEEITVTNVAGSIQTYDIYFVPDGGAAGTTNAVLYQEQIAADTSLRLTTVSQMMLNELDTLQALTNTNAGINITLWGVEVEGIV